MTASNESVVLLHGLIRSDKSMSKLERVLTERSYHVENVSYASRQKESRRSRSRRSGRRSRPRRITGCIS